MINHKKLYEEKTPGRTVVFYGSNGHVHRMEGKTVNPSRDTIEAISTCGENVVREHIICSPYESSVTLILDRKLVGPNRLAPRAKSASHINLIRSLEEMFKYAALQK